MKKVCEHCSNEFEANRSSIRFCSKSCSAQWRVKNHPLPKTCFEKGKPSWNTGNSISGMSGKQHSAQTKQKMRESSSGEKSSNWKGGITEEHYRIRRSRKYADWRKAVFERDGYTCVICNAKSVAGKRIRIEADHILQFATHPDLRFDVSNGRTLCVPCHRKTDTWGKKAVHAETGKTFEAMSNGKTTQESVAA